MLSGLSTSAFVPPKFGVCLPCFYIKGAPKHFLQHSTLLLGGASILCIFSRTSCGSFLSASLYSLSKTSEIEKAQLRLFKKHCTIHTTIPIKCFWWFLYSSKIIFNNKMLFFFLKCTFSDGTAPQHITVDAHCSFTVPSAYSNVFPPPHSRRESLRLCSTQNRGQDEWDQERVRDHKFR